MNEILSTSKCFFWINISYWFDTQLVVNYIAVVVMSIDGCDKNKMVGCWWTSSLLNSLDVWDEIC